jgi:hypothetical protein
MCCRIAVTLSYILRSMCFCGDMNGTSQLLFTDCYKKAVGDIPVERTISSVPFFEFSRNLLLACTVMYEFCLANEEWRYKNKHTLNIILEFPSVIQYFIRLQSRMSQCSPSRNKILQLICVFSPAFCLSPFLKHHHEIYFMHYKFWPLAPTQQFIKNCNKQCIPSL